jgi:gluconate kinase
MSTKKRSEALTLKIIAKKKGKSPVGKALASQANKAFIDAQRLQRVQQAFEKARHGKNLFGLEDAE